MHYGGPTRGPEGEAPVTQSDRSTARADRSTARAPQLAYSQIQPKMHDEEQRRHKAHKILHVLHHFLGRPDLTGLSVLDIGCSTGFLANEIATDGADVVGVDIDVPGVTAATKRFGDRVRFLCSSADALPLPDSSVDVVVFNHIYEHVVDPDAVVTEIHRVLKPDGVVYLGLGNKYQLVEPHHQLPLLSWLPQAWADRYMRRAGRGDSYYEQHRSRRGLKTLARGFNVWDYTIPIVRHPDVFGSGDQVKGLASRLPTPAVRALMPIVPTFIWVGTKTDRSPAEPTRPRLISYAVFCLKKKKKK